MEQVVETTPPVTRVETPVNVRELTPDVEKEWDRFVEKQPDGSFFHLTGWKKVIETTFGHEPRYLYAERNGVITGVAPMFRVSNWVVGRCLVSVPLAAYGGICAADSDSHRCLTTHFQEEATASAVDFLELRHRSGGILQGFHRNPLYVTFTTALSAEPEENLKRLPRDTRYMIRKAEKKGLYTRSGFDQLNVFYELFAQNMRNHGTPVFPRALFDNLIAVFEKTSDLTIVYKDAQPISGVLSFFFRDAILPYYAGAGPDAPRLAANNFMYWELMRKAALSGLRTFDFGRSKVNTGAYAFKSQWNMNVEALDYQVFLVRRKTVPNFSPLNPKFHLATQAWRHLPLWLTKRVGPHVVRWIP